MTELVTTIWGQQVSNPVEWRGTKILCTFDKASTEATLTTETFLFPNDAAQRIIEYYEGGMNGTSPGILSGIPITFELFKDGQSEGLFDGCGDFSNDFTIISPVEVSMRVKRRKGVQTISETAQGISYFSRVKNGQISPSQYSAIPYVVEKKFNGIEFAMLSLTLLLFIDQTVTIIKETTKDIGNATAHGTDVPPNPAGATVWTVVSIAANAVYFAIMVIQIAKLIDDMQEYLIGRIKQHNGFNLKRLAEDGAQALDLTYSSSNAVLENLYYLPSKTVEGYLSGGTITQQGVPTITQPQANALQPGVPRSEDYGYTVFEIFDLINQMFYSRIAIEGNTMHQEPLINDSYWIRQSNFTLPDTQSLDETIRVDFDSINKRTFIRFSTDFADEWTLDDPQGKVYEVVTELINDPDPKCSLLKGIDEVSLPVALASRKDGLTAFEIAFQGVAAVADAAINLFGGNSSLAQQIQNRVGLPRFTQDITNVPKILYMLPTSDGLRIPANHKQIFSAEALYEYHAEKSIVRTVNGVPYRGQKRLILNEEIPFGWDNFISLLNNSYLFTPTGEQGKAEKLEWEFDGDVATVDGWFRKPFTTNVKETVNNSDNTSL